MTCSVCGCKAVITLVISDVSKTIERNYCQKCYDELYNKPKDYWINRKDSHATEKTTR